MARDICISLGERIRELRKQKGWRQIDLAQHSGVHEVHISDLERGTREAGLRTVLAIAQALDVRLSTMFRGLETEL
jgi:transcriptional regulator with XRE-family HTH domain